MFYFPGSLIQANQIFHNLLHVLFVCFYVQRGKTSIEIPKFYPKYQNFPAMSFPLCLIRQF